MTEGMEGSGEGERDERRRRRREVVGKTKETIRICFKETERVYQEGAAASKA